MELMTQEIVQVASCNLPVASCYKENDFVKYKNCKTRQGQCGDGNDVHVHGHVDVDVEGDGE